jgi:hypothetical protein
LASFFPAAVGQTPQTTGGDRASARKPRDLITAALINLT